MAMLSHRGEAMRRREFISLIGSTMTARMDENDNSTLDIADFPIACPKCGNQMRLFAIEWETERRDIYTFVCDLCGHTVARGVLTQ
jgi:predicted RNA-binding Zn-ribbon protein involved in translation (DUF1610 family)